MRPEARPSGADTFEALEQIEQVGLDAFEFFA